jgi:kanamycin kinase
VTFPTEQPSVPDVVTHIAANRPVSAVWLNEIGGTTFRIGAGEEYVKVYPDAEAPHLLAEEMRLAWAAAFSVVPRVLSSGPGWLHTAGLPGRSAVDPYWVARPVAAARAIGAGLRLLHDALPVTDCPFRAPSWASGAPPADQLVVCHGDACAPNTLIGDDGRCSGHVDLGELGVADLWADLAIATLSLGWNYPAIEENVLLDAYGVTRDEQRIAYYRARWEQAPPAAG